MFGEEGIAECADQLRYVAKGSPYYRSYCCHRPSQYIGFATAPLTDGGTKVDPSLAPPFPGIDGTPSATAARHVFIYPNTFMSIYPHHIFRVIVEPISPDKSRERTSLLVHPSIYGQVSLCTLLAPS